MKNNISLLLIALVSIGLGLLSGYYLFRGQETDHAHDHAPQTEGEAQVYTCSMHPQIRQDGPGICPLCEMDLTPLESGQSSDNKLVLEMTQSAVRLAGIRTQAVGESQAGNGQQLVLNGKLQADERRISSQVAHLPGRIEQLYVAFTGEAVRKGQRLAELYSPELVAAQEELLQAQRLEGSSPQLLAAAKQRLRRWKISDAVIQQVLDSGQPTERFTLHADVSGLVANRLVSVGDYVKVGEPLFTLSQLDRLWVVFDAYESDLKQIKLGDEVSFTTPALPGHDFRTRITFISPSIDPATRTAGLRGEVLNAQGRLKPEMFVKGQLLSGKRERATGLRVPKSAVLWTGTRSVVYVKVPDSEVPAYEFRVVELGEAVGGAYSVAAGLSEGEEVVVNGAFVIDAAAQLNNQASMMNQEITIEGQEAPSLPNYEEQVPAAFQKQLSELMEAYLALKDALVETEADRAAQAAQGLLERVNAALPSALSGAAAAYWEGKRDALRQHSGKIAQSKDVETQRQQFEFVSLLLIEASKVLGVHGKTLYVQYCPMAFDNQGAPWLSQETAILNPYFGDKMLRCGVVQDSL